MDPISAAGIGLSVTSLLLQVFAGCIKGYQLFVDIDGMPGAYQHLRLRLRIEQTRLLNWGEKVGLLEEILDKPSRRLEMNRNMILDILLEIQSTFKATTTIAAKYDRILPHEAVSTTNSSPSGNDSVLQKTLALLEKTPQLSTRLHWAVVNQKRFAELIDKLIRYNDSIESFLDKASLDQLQIMQQRTYMMMLQLTDKVDELKELSQALQIRGHTLAQESEFGISRTSTLVAETDIRNNTTARLADFKAQQALSSSTSHNLKITEKNAIHLIPNNTDRPGVVYKQKRGWVEWKFYDKSTDPKSTWNRIIEDRVDSLVNLLASGRKPNEFRAPRCLGYFEDTSADTGCYGFIYENPVQNSDHEFPVSLRSLFETEKRPSLNQRIALGHAVAQSLMYLHSVNWLHKGVRSDNVLFFPSRSGQLTKHHFSLSSPILSGFDYARPDLPDTVTERPSQNLRHDLYRHSELTTLTSDRSKKSYDIYSLGIILIEIALWQAIEKVLEIDLDKKGATRRVRNIRDELLNHENEYFVHINGFVGESYAEVVRKCLTGGPEIGIPQAADETNPSVGVEMQRTFAEDIVGRLASVKV